jgi:hypothetical protein
MNTIPFQYICIIPTIVTSAVFFSQFRQPNTAIYTIPHLTRNIPTLKPLLTESDKLSFLTAWQSTTATSVRLMKFSNDQAICIDTGASVCISNRKSDFINFTPHDSSSVLKGITSGLQIHGTGTLKWSILTDDGDEVTLYLHNCLYVPDAPMCLLSPQHMAQQTMNTSDGFHSHSKHGVLTFAGHKCTIYYNHNTNLPILFSAMTTCTQENTFDHLSSLSNEALLSSIDQHPQANLSPTQRKLLKLHQKMGHLNMQQVQTFAKNGIFGPAYQKLGTCDLPLCKSCMHSKQHRSPVTPTTSPGIIDALHLEPGDCVSGDQVESYSPGLVPTYKGKPTTSKYHAGTLLVDHASRYLHFTPHLSTGSQEALQEKHHFESFASHHNRHIKCYHTDNGIFTSKDFQASCLQNHQRTKFCGVNAHHQNGIAERHIRTITERARTMLIHAMLSWPDIIQENLWPFAMQLAVDLHNSTPTLSGLTPEEIFTGVKGRNRLQDFHTFGCPIFVLDPSLQQGHKIPRWKPRSRVGVYLGMSPNHASNIPLVLSTTTGLVSPQFHVVYDDSFTTTTCLADNKLPTNWNDLLTTSSEKFVDETFNPTIFSDTSWFSPNSTSTDQCEDIHRVNLPLYAVELRQLPPYQLLRSLQGL